MPAGRFGFCCKWIDHSGQLAGLKPGDAAKKFNTGTTTISWLNRQTKSVAEQRLWDLMVQNIEATRCLVERVGQLPPALRMVRISSDILPAYTEPSWSYFWQRPDVREYCERHFAQVGDLARTQDVRLSFHPGQFCVLASANDNIVERSIEEFEYHVNMARWMGYGASWHDHGFKINVHIAGKRGPQGILDVLPRLSPEARNLITIENEEISYGLDACLTIADHVAVVLDLHHNWVNTGQYIAADDARVQMVIDSWRGVRPTLHYSVSREDVLSGHLEHQQPDLVGLLESGHNKQKLRAHSDFYWNSAVNDWALTFADQFDIQCESKAKNLSSFALYEYACKQQAKKAP